MKKLLVVVLLAASATAAYAALTPANEMAERERIEPKNRIVYIQYYTEPVLLYGKPIPRDPKAEMPNFAGLFEPFHNTPDY